MTKFTHTKVWRAIDRTAEAHGLSPSGLAKAAALDPTAFNRSKRMSPTKAALALRRDDCEGPE